MLSPAPTNILNAITTEENNHEARFASRGCNAACRVSGTKCFGRLGFDRPYHSQAASHGHHHADFSAGEPGDPKKPARPVAVVMREIDGKMVFIPDRVEVKIGEQVRFLLRNNGELDHEFVLGTAEENLKHAEQMKKFSDTEHEDLNGKRLSPKKTAEIVWRFTMAGQFEYGCLIPGHREAGMTGFVAVR